MSNNRFYNSKNPYQGDYKKVLCVCSAGLLRSPTTALVLSKDPFNFNTRAVGLDTRYALIPIDYVLLHWADTILCMNDGQLKEINKMIEDSGVGSTEAHSLDIEDSFSYRDEGLISIIKEKALKIFKIEEK